MDEKAHNSDAEAPVVARADALTRIDGCVKRDGSLHALYNAKKFAHRTHRVDAVEQRKAIEYACLAGCCFKRGFQNRGITTYRRVAVNGCAGWSEKHPPLGSSSRANTDGPEKFGWQSQSTDPVVDTKALVRQSPIIA